MTVGPSTSAGPRTSILYINPTSQIGGGERSLLELMTGLDRTRWEPVAACVDEGPLTDALRGLDVAVEINPWPAFALRIGRGSALSRAMAPVAAAALAPHLLRMAKLVRHRGIGIIHTNGLKSHLVGSMVMALTGRPLIWHVRDVIQAGAVRSLFQLFGRATASRVIANSRVVASLFPSLEPDRLAVVYNGLDTVNYSPGPAEPGVRASLGLAPDHFVVGAVGALAPLKGHIHLIRAAPEIFARRPDARILIVGDELYVTGGHPGYGAVLREEIRRLGLEGRVIMTGYRERVVELYRAMDVLVHASVYPESFGRVLVEAMACGVPVVATALGGPTEIISSPEEGLLIPSESPEAIAGSVIELAGDTDRMATMAQSGRERVVGAFSGDRYVREVQRIYATLCPAA